MAHLHFFPQEMQIVSTARLKGGEAILWAGFLPKPPQSSWSLLGMQVPQIPPPPGLQVPGREGAWQELLSALFLESLDGSGTKSADPSYLIPHLPCFCEI